MILNNIKMEVPENWRDVSADIAHDAPFTLAAEAGIGALQISVAKYQFGKKPMITESDLRSLFIKFCQSHSFSAEPVVLKEGKMLCIGGISNTNKELVAIWYMSDGLNVILVTYTSLDSINLTTVKELAESKKMVESIEYIET